MIKKILDYFFSNKIYVVTNGKKRRVLFVRGLIILFKGYHNTAIIYSNSKIKNCKLVFEGNNNFFELESCKKLKRTKFVFSGQQGKIIIKRTKNNIYDSFINLSNNNQEIIIEEDFSVSNANIHLWNSNSKLHIGKDNMFSWGINIMIGDGHQIIDKQSTQNIKNDICRTEDHVWICHNSFLSKNCYIPRGCIVGANSVVTKKFTKESCVIAGNPAKVVKENIEWLRDKSL